MSFSLKHTRREWLLAWWHGIPNVLKNGARRFDSPPEYDSLPLPLVLRREARHLAVASRRCAGKRTYTHTSAHVHHAWWATATYLVAGGTQFAAHNDTVMRAKDTTHNPLTRTSKIVRGDASLCPNSTPLSRCSHANDGTRVLPPGAGVVLGPTPMLASISSRVFSRAPIRGPWATRGRRVTSAVCSVDCEVWPHLLLLYVGRELRGKTPVLDIWPLPKQIRPRAQIRIHIGNVTVSATSR